MSRTPGVVDAVRIVLTTMLISVLAARPAAAVGTSFTYQGQLSVNGAPADGVCNLQFGLFAAANGGAALATVGPLAVRIAEGLFSVALDFGGNFSGADRWLEISAACLGHATEVLAPRQPITAAPYALFANGAGTVRASGDDQRDPAGGEPCARRVRRVGG